MALEVGVGLFETALKNCGRAALRVNETLPLPPWLGRIQPSSTRCLEKIAGQVLGMENVKQMDAVEIVVRRVRGAIVKPGLPDLEQPVTVLRRDCIVRECISRWLVPTLRLLEWAWVRQISAVPHLYPGLLP